MSLGYGDDGCGVGDSPRPGERAEDPRRTWPRDESGLPGDPISPTVRRMTDAEYLAQVRKWGEVAKARKEKKS